MQTRAAIYCEDWGDGSGGMADNTVDNLVAIFEWKMFKSHMELEC